METIETLQPAVFVEYLKTFSNTICGRYPISVLLQVKFELLTKSDVQVVSSLIIYLFNQI